MNGIIDIIEGDHDVFVVEKETTRLSDAIDNFKNSETAQLAVSVSKALSLITEKSVNSDLLESLRDGTTLCILLEKCAPSVHIGKWHRNPRSIVAFESENIYFFSQACIELGMYQTSVINYNVFVNQDIRQLVTCIINLFKILYPKLPVSESKVDMVETVMGDILESSGTLTHEDRERIQKQHSARTSLQENESVEQVVEEIAVVDEMLGLDLQEKEVVDTRQEENSEQEGIQHDIVHNQELMEHDIPNDYDITEHDIVHNQELTEHDITIHVDDVELDEGAQQFIVTPIDEAEELEERNFNSEIEEYEAIAKLLEEEMQQLQNEDEERIERERIEREQRLERIRLENGVVSSSEENEWEEEEKESKRRTIFIRSLRHELAEILEQVKQKKMEGKVEVKEKQAMVQKKLESDNARRKREMIERERIQREKRMTSFKKLTEADKREQLRKEQLRKERKIYEKQLKERDEQREKREKEKRRKDQNEVKRRIEIKNKEKEEEKQRNAEKKRLWLEEKKRLEEEEKKRMEAELRKKKERALLEQKRINTAKPKSPIGSPKRSNRKVV